MVALTRTPLQFRRMSGSSPAPFTYIAISAIYSTVYLAINYFTTFRQFGHSSITLWSPDNAISLLLLTEFIAYTPVVLIASICVDVFISHVDYGLMSVFASEFIVVQGYLLIAVLLRDRFNYDFRVATYPNMLALLAVVPASAAMTSVLFCGALYLTGSLPAKEVYTAGRYFWIGDTVGMIVVLPAATAVYDVSVKASWRDFLMGKSLMTMTLVGLCTTALVLTSVADIRNRYLFDLLFLPTIWVGIGYGYGAVAILLLAIQLLLVGSLAYFHADDQNFAIFQTLMLILAATGQVLGAVVTEREGTIRKLRRQQADLARFSSHATSGVLAATLAREISQPLSSLAGYVHGARRMLDNDQPRKSIAGALAKAEAEARRTREIIAGIREFVSTGSLQTEPTDLRALCRKITALNHDDAQLREVGLTFEEPEHTILADCDRIAIEQALNNLVVNAIDAVGLRGNVIVRLSKVEDHAFLQVDDDGPGVSPEIGERLFDVFETTKAHGMGLGLPLARQIVERHEGRLIWVPLQPHGTRFTIELPIRVKGDHHA